MARHVDPAVTAWRQSGKPMVQRHLIWVEAQALDGTPMHGGFWDGQHDDHLPVVRPLDGVVASRLYHAGGGVIEVEPVGHFSGLDINPARVTLSPVTPEVDDQLRLLVLRRAPVELHRIWLDFEARQPIAAGHVWFTGRIGRAPLTTPAAGGSERLTYTILPPTRDLTFGNPEPVSDTIQSQRQGDRIFRHLATAGVREIPWMRKG